MSLKKELGFWDVFCISSGAMISSGLFVLPAIAYSLCGKSVFVAYFLAGILGSWERAGLSKTPIAIINPNFTPNWC